MINPEKKKDLEKQGYRLVGEHSAVKACLWTKKSLVGEGTCYKQKFYGIQSHRCVQMTPSLPFCGLRCVWCWRDTNHTAPKWLGEADEPKKIIKESIEQHVKYLLGFGGNKKTIKKIYEESKKPLHFAISLAGEPTLYPKLPEFIKELKKQNLTSFLVTNATNPDMLRALKDSLPTQLYITLPAPNKEVFQNVCAPLIKNGWESIKQSLEVMKTYKGKTRTTIRITASKGLNMINPEQYAELIKIAEPLFVEVKAYVWVGHSKKRLEKEVMPFHEEIKEFSEKLAKALGYKIIDEFTPSRVVLLMKEDVPERIMEF